MKHKNLCYISVFFILVGSLVSCDSSNEVKNNEETTNDFKLVGNNDFNKDFTLNNDVYELKDVKLKRGDSFLISGQEDLAYKNIKEEDKAYFKDGKSNNIIVFNEGIYDISISGEEEKIVDFLKTDSSYSSVKLISSKGTFDFNKTDNFTFEVKDIPLLYNDSFFVEADGEKLSASYLNVTDENLAKYFYNYNNNIKTEIKGTFDFTLDFSKELPLILSSSNYSEPNEILENNEDLRSFIDEIGANFSQNVKESKLKIETINSENNTHNEEVYSLVYDLNQAYEKTTFVKDEETKEDIKANYFDDKQFYQVNVYESNPLSSNADGVRIVDSEDKDGYTIEEAKKQISSFQGDINLFIDSTIKQLLDGAYVSDLEKDNYFNSVEFTSYYKDDVGDALVVEASNLEYSESYFSGAYVFKYEFKAEIDNDGNLINIEFTKNEYSQNDVSYDEMFDKYYLKDNVSPIEITKYSLNATYGERKEVTEFILDPKIYFTQNVFGIGANLMAGDTFDESKLGIQFLPATAIDTDNFYIKSYDEEFIQKNYLNYTLKKGGQTKLIFGNDYNDVEAEITINGQTPSPSSIEFKDLDYNTNYFENMTYRFAIKVLPTYSRQDVKIEVLTPETAKIIETDDVETANKNGQTTFEVEFLKAGETKLKIISLEDESISLEKTIMVKESMKLDDFAGAYVKYSTYDGFVAPYKIDLNASGTLKIYFDDNAIEFKVKCEGDTLVLDGEIELVESFEATLEKRDSLVGSNVIKSVKCYFKDSLNYDDISYESFYSLNYYNGSFIDETNQARLEFQYSYYDLESGSGLITIGDRTIEFERRFSSSLEERNDYLLATEISEYYINDSLDLVNQINLVSVKKDEICMDLISDNEILSLNLVRETTI